METRLIGIGHGGHAVAGVGIGVGAQHQIHEVAASRDRHQAIHRQAMHGRGTMHLERHHEHLVGAA